jgi:hypothetical protein
MSLQHMIAYVVPYLYTFSRTIFYCRVTASVTFVALPYIFFLEINLVPKIRTSRLLIAYFNFQLHYEDQFHCVSQ